MLGAGVDLIPVAHILPCSVEVEIMAILLWLAESGWLHLSTMVRNWIDFVRLDSKVEECDPRTHAS